MTLSVREPAHAAASTWCGLLSFALSESFLLLRLDRFQITFERLTVRGAAINLDDVLRGIEHERVGDADAVELRKHILSTDGHRVVDLVFIDKRLHRFETILVECNSNNLRLRI